AGKSGKGFRRVARRALAQALQLAPAKAALPGTEDEAGLCPPRQLRRKRSAPPYESHLGQSAPCRSRTLGPGQQGETEPGALSHAPPQCCSSRAARREDGDRGDCGDPGPTL